MATIPSITPVVLNKHHQKVITDLKQAINAPDTDAVMEMVLETFALALGHLPIDNIRKELPQKLAESLLLYQKAAEVAGRGNLLAEVHPIKQEGEVDYHVYSPFLLASLEALQQEVGRNIEISEQRKANIRLQVANDITPNA